MRLIETIRNDSVVINDFWTGRNLNSCQYSCYSINYISYLHVCPIQPKKDRCLDRTFENNNVKYFYGYDSDCKIYSGGSRKPHSTAEVLFGIANGEKIENFQWDFTYYPQFEILEFGSGGHHRTIAHLLWGELMKPERFEIIIFDENCFCDEINQLYLKSDRKGLRFKDVEALKKYWSLTKRDHEYFKEVRRFREIDIDSEYSLDEIDSMLSELDYFLSQTRIQRRIKSFYRWVGLEPEINDLEKYIRKHWR